MGTDCEDGLPVCNGIGANDGVDGGEFVADVAGGAAGVRVEFKVTFFGCLFEFGLRVGGG